MSQMFRKNPPPNSLIQKQNDVISCRPEGSENSWTGAPSLADFYVHLGTTKNHFIERYAVSLLIIIFFGIL